jgi:hypothetical protein
MTAPRVELLWWAGCPSHAKAKTMLEEALEQQGLDPECIETLQIVTDEEAIRERFVGSPTIRINGADIVPPADPTPALACRLYIRRDGRPSPLPDPQDLHDALHSTLKD